jgi:hypothetical protein
MPVTLSDAHLRWASDFTGLDLPRAGAPAMSDGANGSDPQAATQSGPAPAVGEPIGPDCKLKHNMVDGPPNHVLCETHGHIVNTATKPPLVIFASLADYHAHFPVPRAADPDCTPVHSKMPKAPANIVLCKHGHVLDTAYGGKAGQTWIVANTPSMYFRAHPDQESQIDYQTPDAPPIVPPGPSPGPPPSPAPPAPDPPPGPAPAPDPPPNPNPSPDPPPKPPDKVVAPEKVAHLRDAIAALIPKTQAALAAAEAERDAAQTQGLDWNDPSTVSTQLGQATQAFDDGAMKTLRNALGLVDEARDALGNTWAEMEAGKDRIHAFKGIKDLQLQYQDHQNTATAQQEAADRADDAAKQYDLAVNVMKAIVDVGSADPDKVLIGGGQALLEILGADIPKDAVSRQITDIKNTEEEIEDYLGKATDILVGFATEVVKAEVDHVRRLGDLSRRQFEHYRTALTTFWNDYDTMKAAGGKPAPKATAELKKIKDAYGRMLAVRKQFDSVEGEIEGDSALADPVVRDGMVPIGTYDAEASQAYLNTNPIPILKAVPMAYRNAKQITVFLAPIDIDQSTLEKMADDMVELAAFRSHCDRLRAMADDWSAAVSSGLAVQEEPVR